MTAAMSDTDIERMLALCEQEDSQQGDQCKELYAPIKIKKLFFMTVEVDLIRSSPFNTVANKGKCYCKVESKPLTEYIYKLTGKNKEDFKMLLPFDKPGEIRDTIHCKAFVRISFETSNPVSSIIPFFINGYTERDCIFGPKVMWPWVNKQSDDPKFVDEAAVSCKHLSAFGIKESKVIANKIINEK